MSQPGDKTPIGRVRVAFFSAAESRATGQVRVQLSITRALTFASGQAGLDDGARRKLQTELDRLEPLIFADPSIETIIGHFRDGELMKVEVEDRQ